MSRRINSRNRRRAERYPHTDHAAISRQYAPESAEKMVAIYLAHRAEYLHKFNHASVDVVVECAKNNIRAIDSLILQWEDAENFPNPYPAAI